MKKILDLCQLPRRPSEVLDLKEAGYTWGQRLDFDFALVSFKQWFDSMAQETTWVPADKGHEGQVQVPKYATVEAILQLYRTEHVADQLADTHVDNIDDLILGAIEAQSATF